MPKEAQDSKKFWSIKNLSKNKGELTLYGQIAQSSWWDDVVTPKQFVKDLKDLGEIEEIDVRVNSNGGDVFAGQTIYALLKSHSATVTVYIDGLAASIASIIAMAGDKIVMHPGAMMMIHNPSSSLWGGEAKDFRKTADVLDKVKESLISTYKAKTNKEDKELEDLMNEETWLTAEEALEKGFIDEISGSEIEACVRSNQVFFNGIGFDMEGYTNIPKFKNTVFNNASSTEILPEHLLKIQNLQPEITDKKNEEEVIVNREDFKNKYPELYKEVKNEGVNQERERMKAIDDLATPGNDEIVNKAKYETGISAEQMAVEIIKAEKGKGAKFLANREVDVDESNVNDVKQLAGDIKNSKEEEKEAAENIANIMNKKRGLK